MTRKVNPIISGRLFPFVPNKPPKKTDMPLAGKVVPPKSNPINKPDVPFSPRAGAVSRPKHTGRNIAITAALALVTLAVVKGVKDYKADHKAENPKEMVKK